MKDEELRRLQALEQLVRALVRDMDALRAQLGMPRGEYVAPPAGAAAAGAPSPHVAAAAPASAPAGAPSVGAPRPVASTPPPAPTREPTVPPAAPSSRPPASSQWSLEELVGRYGTVALGAAVILAGVGVLVSWAVAQGMFGPRVRLALAAVVAGGFAFVGMRLRARGAQRFGNVLLALSLALTQMVAWGAGPALDIVPHALAFALAAAASAALALLALRHGEETLYVVGVAGALVAPFITIDGDSSSSLLAYGIIVLGAALVPLHRHAWRLAPALVVLGATIYAGIAMAATPSIAAPWLRAAPFTFVLVLAWVALAVKAPAAIVFALLGGGALVAHPGVHVGALNEHTAVALAPLAAVALATAYLTMRVRTSGFASSFAAVLAPFGTLGLAIMYLPGPVTRWSALVPALWMLAAAAMTWFDSDRRELHGAVAVACGAVAIAMGLEHPWMSVALLVYTLVAVRAALRLGLSIPLAPAFITLGLVVLANFAGFVDSRIYSVPFQRDLSMIGAASVAALIVHARLLAGREILHRTLIVAAVAAAFFWIRFELARAISPDVATFALILYYAVAGVAGITVGRMRAIAPARHAGLVIACYAGLKALVEASDLEHIALRFGAFMLVDIFLLGVAYRYWPRRALAPPEPLVPETK